MNNVAVDRLKMRYLSDGHRSNSLHREIKIELALMIPPEHGGKREHDGTKQRDAREELLRSQGMEEKRMLVVE